MGQPGSKKCRQDPPNLFKGAAFLVLVPAYKDRYFDASMWKQSTEDEKLRSLLQQVAILVQVPTCKDLITFRHTIANVIEQLTSGTKTMQLLVVERQKLYQIAMNFFNQVRDKHVKIQIKFKIDGLEEEGVDSDGLRQEFFSSLFKECLMGKHDLFEGTGRRMIPSKNQQAVQNGYFLSLGRAIVSSILNEGAGFPYLVESVFYYLIDKSYREHLNAEDVMDEVIREFLSKIDAAKTEREIVDAISDEKATFLNFIGWPKAKAITTCLICTLFNDLIAMSQNKLKNKEDYKKHILQWYLIDNRKASLDQLKAGLNHLGFLDKVRYDVALQPLLVYSSEYSLSADYINKIFIPEIELLDTKCKKEKKAKEFAIDCIKNITDEEASFLYEFVTGLLDPTIVELECRVEFNHRNKSMKLPESKTCSQLLIIPLGNETMADFHSSFKTALIHGRSGFALDWVSRKDN